MTRRAQLSPSLFVEIDAAGDVVLTEEEPRSGSTRNRIELDTAAWEALCLYMSQQGASDGD